ncbi:hypothetical protein [Acinetobacter gyllenbergii]|uniref:hypothetical protein n=1 Tax=Acinetobacter gyllenbergii TaxID=134534 RepID=UPI003F542B06
MDASQFVDALVNIGWVKEFVEIVKEEKVIDNKLPSEIEELCSKYSVLRNKDDTFWFYSEFDYVSAGDSAFEWDFFEKNSLECSVNDVQKSHVLNFWRAHLPFGVSVVNGYSYVALRIEDGVVVIGVEPEYEDSAKVIAKSLEDFYELFVLAADVESDVLMGLYLGK